MTEEQTITITDGKQEVKISQNDLSTLISGIEEKIRNAWTRGDSIRYSALLDKLKAFETDE